MNASHIYETNDNDTELNKFRIAIKGFLSSYRSGASLSQHIDLLDALVAPGSNMSDR